MEIRKETYRSQTKLTLNECLMNYLRKRAIIITAPLTTNPNNRPSTRPFQDLFLIYPVKNIPIMHATVKVIEKNNGVFIMSFF